MRARVKILRTREPDLSEWSDYYSRLRLPGVYHSPDYIRVLEGQCGDRAELFLFGNEDRFAYYPFFRRSLGDLPFVKGAGTGLSDCSDIVTSWYYGGPLVSKEDDELIDRFRLEFGEYCRDQRIVSEFIRFDPYVGNDRYVTGSVKVWNDREVVFINLQLSESDIVNGYDRKCRKNIRRARDAGVQVRFQWTEADIKKFHEIYDSEMKRKCAPKKYFFPTEFFFDLLSSVNGSVLTTIYVGGSFAGGSLVIQQGEMVSDYLRATDPSFWNLRINDYVVHRNAMFFKERGARIYDLQGGREGVFRFKRAFSSSTLWFRVGSCIHLPEEFRELCRLAPSLSEDFFPPYREKDTN